MPAGQPTPYKEEYAIQVEKLCKLGATDAEIGEFFDVTETTINNWKTAHPEFFESIKKGKTIADMDVAGSLYKRAIGYTVDEVTFEKVDNKVNLEITSSGEMKQDDSYKKKVVTKEVAPDVTAQIFWLKNRQKKKWRDKIETGFTDEDGKDVNPVTIFQLPDNGRSKSNTSAEGLPGEGS